MPKEPCMCGAIDCRVCGPLQGYRIDYDEPEDWDIPDDEIHGVDGFVDESQVDDN